MAVTKIGQIRSTLKAALEYVVDPKKTNGGILTSSNCGIPQLANSVYIAFREIHEKAENAHTTGGYGTVLAFHVIQSFKPGEVTQNLAHDIGVELVEAITHGEYDYVVATHVDKDHIHNHIIFHSVNRNTLKHFRCPKRRYFEIREISDELCRKHGLSIIENPGENLKPGEIHARAHGRSKKAQLELFIDEAVRNSYSWEAFTDNLNEMGIRTFFQGGQLMFRAPQILKREIRGRTLGVAYSESALMSRLGRQNLSEYIVQPSMVKVLDEQRYRVQVPGHRRKRYIVVFNHQINDHGTHFRMYLPDNWEGRMTDSFGQLAEPTTAAELYNWFSRLDPVRQSAPARTTVPIGLDSNTARERYRAVIAKKIEDVREEAALDGLRLEYEKAPDKQAFISGLREELATTLKQLESALIEKQRRDDLQAPYLGEDIEVENATRKARVLRTAIKEQEKDNRKQKKIR